MLSFDSSSTRVSSTTLFASVSMDGNTNKLFNGCYTSRKSSTDGKLESPHFREDAHCRIRGVRPLSPDDAPSDLVAETRHPPETRCQSGIPPPYRNRRFEGSETTISPETWCGRYKWTDSRRPGWTGVRVEAPSPTPTPNSTDSHAERVSRWFTGNPVCLFPSPASRTGPHRGTDTHRDIRPFHRKRGVCQRCNVLGPRRQNVDSRIHRKRGVSAPLSTLSRFTGSEVWETASNPPDVSTPKSTSDRWATWSIHRKRGVQPTGVLS